MSRSIESRLIQLQHNLSCNEFDNDGAEACGIAAALIEELEQKLKASKTITHAQIDAGGAVALKYLADKSHEGLNDSSPIALTLFATTLAKLVLEAANSVAD